MTAAINLSLNHEFSAVLGWKRKRVGSKTLFMCIWIVDRQHLVYVDHLLCPNADGGSLWHVIAHKKIIEKTISTAIALELGNRFNGHCAFVAQSVPIPLWFWKCTFPCLEIHTYPTKYIDTLHNFRSESILFHCHLTFYIQLDLQTNGVYTPLVNTCVKLLFEQIHVFSDR